MVKKLIGYKMTKPDGSCFSSEGNHVVYEVGKVVSESGAKDNQPCGVGLHLGKKKHIPLTYNARYPWRLFECSYVKKFILGLIEEYLRPTQEDPSKAKRKATKDFENAKPVQEAPKEDEDGPIIPDKTPGGKVVSKTPLQDAGFKTGDKVENPFLPCLEIAELGCAFYGIDKDGIAHVIAPSKDEVKT